MKALWPIVILIILVIANISQGATALTNEKIKATTDIKQWRIKMDSEGRKQIKEGTFDDDSGLTDCRETKEIRGTFLCMSFFQADIKAFFEATLAECNLGKKDFCLNKSEQEFYENILKPIEAKYSTFIILGFSYQSFDGYQSNVGHEMMHAQYFFNKSYRDAVKKFWANEVPQIDKAKIRTVLDGEGYDPKDESLMINEFQSFILEPGAENDRLGIFARTYHKALATTLESVGVTPVQIH